MGTQLSYSIRTAILSDAVEIARLAGQLGYPAGADEILGRLEPLLHRPSHLIAVAAAEKESQLFGWIAAEDRNLLLTSERVEIMGLVVDQIARRQGIAQALIADVERWSLERGVCQVVVRSNVVRPESHPFYERLGYHREKSQHVYLKELL